jgi:hypothetical protein
MFTSLAVFFYVAGSAAVQATPRATSVAAAVSDDGAQVTSDSLSVPRGPQRTLVRAATTRQAPRPELRPEEDENPPQRRRAIEHSDWYYRRLAIHKTASFATVPLFVAEYAVGNKLFDGDASSSVRSTHQALATGIGVLFGVNTVTGVWNLWDTRHETQGRTRRITHAALMLASDAGFVATAALAPEGDDVDEGGDDGGSSGRSRHRAVAISSMGVALAGYLMMYIWK